MIGAIASFFGGGPDVDEVVAEAGAAMGGGIIVQMRSLLDAASKEIERDIREEGHVSV